MIFSVETTSGSTCSGHFGVELGAFLFLNPLHFLLLLFMFLMSSPPPVHTHKVICLKRFKQVTDRETFYLTFLNIWYHCVCFSIEITWIKLSSIIFSSQRKKLIKWCSSVNSKRPFFVNVVHITFGIHYNLARKKYPIENIFCSACIYRMKTKSKNWNWFPWQRKAVLFVFFPPKLIFQD